MCCEKSAESGVAPDSAATPTTLASTSAPLTAASASASTFSWRSSACSSCTLSSIRPRSAATWATEPSRYSSNTMMASRPLARSDLRSGSGAGAAGAAAEFMASPGRRAARQARDAGRRVQRYSIAPVVRPEPAHVDRQTRCRPDPRCLDASRARGAAAGRHRRHAPQGLPCRPAMAGAARPHQQRPGPVAHGAAALPRPRRARERCAGRAVVRARRAPGAGRSPSS